MVSINPNFGFERLGKMSDGKEKNKLDDKPKAEETPSTDLNSVGTDENSKKDVTREDLTVMWNLFMEYGCGKGLMAVTNYMYSQIEAYIQEHNINVDAKEVFQFFVETFEQMSGHGAMESSYILDKAMNDFVSSHTSKGDKTSDGKKGGFTQRHFDVNFDVAQTYQADIVKANIGKAFKAFNA